MSPEKRGFSLRMRMTVLLLSVMALVWIATAWVSYRQAIREMNELFDAQLVQASGILLAQVNRNISQVAEESHEAEHRYQHKVSFQVWSGDGKLLLRSYRAPLTRMTLLDKGFSNEIINGHRWRVFVRWDEENGQQIQVGELSEVRDQMAASIGLQLLVPLLIGLPVLGMLIWLSVRKGMQPLMNISVEVQQRASGNLAPLGHGSIPREIRPLVNSINDLFSRLKQSFDLEKRFTADAAHELRTALGGLRAQAEVALRAADDEPRKRALYQVIQGVDRGTRLIQQLLTLSRIEAGVVNVSTQQVDLHHIAAEVLSELAPEALEKGIDLELAEGTTSRVRGDAILLQTLLRNLVDNAIRYTPGPGSVTVNVKTTGNEVLLEVTDSGPGIPVDQRQRVFDRFYRILGTNQNGSGLGLSIIKRIAVIHGAEIALDSGPDGKGLLVRLKFKV